MGVADALLLIFVIGLAVAVAWLVNRIMSQKTEMDNLVDDINSQVVDPLSSTQSSVFQIAGKQTALDSQQITTSSNVGALKVRADGLDAAGVGLAKVFQFPGAKGDSLWSQATTLPSQNVDLHLINHTSALGGITVSSTLDVSGGYFSVDSSSGSVKVCGRKPSGTAHPNCTAFNTDVAGTTTVDGPTVFKSDVYGTTFMTSTPTATAVGNSFGLVSGGGYQGALLQGMTTKGSTNSMSCGVDSNLNFVVSSVNNQGTQTNLVTVALNGDVTVNTPGAINLTTPGAIKVTGATVDVSGAFKVNGKTVTGT